MKRLFTFGITLLLIAITGCSDDDKPTGPDVPLETKVSIAGMNPVSPAVLKYYQTSTNDRVQITFNYTVTETDGARIWIQIANEPTGDDIFYYSQSPVYTGSGNKTVLVSAASDKDSIHISQLEILIKNPSQTDTISHSFMDVNYIFTK